jgi:hypothetical protein
MKMAKKNRLQLDVHLRHRHLMNHLRHRRVQDTQQLKV